MCAAVTARMCNARSVRGGVNPHCCRVGAWAAPWIKPWSATPGQNVPQNAVTSRPYCNVILLWLARNRGWKTPRFLTFKQAMDTGGHVRKGEHGTKVYFVKQLRVSQGKGEEEDTRLIPMLREYTVFNVDQCDGLPDSIRAGKPMRVRNPDTRDARKVRLPLERAKAARARSISPASRTLIGLTSTPRDAHLLQPLLRHQRRHDLLWARSSRAAPAGGRLRRSHPQGREAGRPAGAGSRPSSSW